jgi:hypothetical protein
LRSAIRCCFRRRYWRSSHEESTWRCGVVTPRGTQIRVPGLGAGQDSATCPPRNIRYPTLP